MARNGVFSSRRWRPERMDGADGLTSSSATATATATTTTCESQEVHVLAVDDSFVDRKVIEKLLKITSCKVTAVDSGRRALQFLGLDEEKSSVGFNGLKVDLIITDYCMPGMTGFELLKKIKGSSAFRQVPVVIMSSENILARIDSCLEEGAEDFIVKPVKLADVKRLKDYMFGEEHHRITTTTTAAAAAAAAAVVVKEETGICKRKLQETCDINVVSVSVSVSVSSSSSSSSTKPSSTTTATPPPPADATTAATIRTRRSPSPPSSSSSSSSSSPKSLDLTPPTSPTTILDSPTRRLKMSNYD